MGPTNKAKKEAPKKVEDKMPAAANHTDGKPSAMDLASLISPSKNATAIVGANAKAKSTKQSGITWFVFNKHKDAYAIGVVIHADRTINVSSWLSRVADNIVRRGEKDFDPIPFFDGTFFLVDQNGELCKTSKGQ